MKRRPASTATSMEEAMRDPRTLGPWLRRFLADYIVIERQLASNTQKSYRDSFKLLLPFISTTADRRPVGTSAPTSYIGGGGINAWSLFDRLTRARAGGG